MIIAENITSLVKQLPKTVKLVVVSKNKSNEEIMQAYNAGQRVFGDDPEVNMVSLPLSPKQWNTDGIQSWKIPTKS